MTAECSRRLPVLCTLALLWATAASAGVRGEITDRNGVLLAATASVQSVFADPRRVQDPRKTAVALAETVKGTDLRILEAKLTTHSHFIWLARRVDADTAQAVRGLSLPGVGLRAENRRIYPQGALTSHVVGLADYDADHGVSGAESGFDSSLVAGHQVTLSIDVRAQTVVRAALLDAMSSYKARGAAGLVLDANSGEIIADVSLPDFLPADRSTLAASGYRNKLVDEVHELGGVFEVFTTAIALDDGRVRPDMMFDVTHPLQLRSMLLRDDEPSNRPLSVAQVFAHSSMIGAALISARYTPQAQMASLRRLGLFEPLSVDGQAIARPLYHPNLLRDVERTALSYGYGAALAPLQAAVIASGIVNHGQVTPPSLLRRSSKLAPERMRILSEQTSADMRALLRQAVRQGTGRGADVEGFEIGGKTGTAYKLSAGKYDNARRTAWFFGGFPMSERPRFTILVMLDEPQATAATLSHTTAQWNAAPLAGTIILRLAPLLGVMPEPQGFKSL